MTQPSMLLTFFSPATKQHPSRSERVAEPTAKSPLLPPPQTLTFSFLPPFLFRAFEYFCTIAPIITYHSVLKLALVCTFLTVLVSPWKYMLVQQSLSFCAMILLATTEMLRHSTGLDAVCAWHVASTTLMLIFLTGFL